MATRSIEWSVPLVTRIHGEMSITHIVWTAPGGKDGRYLLDGTWIPGVDAILRLWCWRPGQEEWSFLAGVSQQEGDDVALDRLVAAIIAHNPAHAERLLTRFTLERKLLKRD